jgi:hypothetical protein
LISINNIEQLCEFIEAYKPNESQLNQITIACFGSLFITPDLTNKQQIEHLKAFWNKYKNELEIPLFIDDIDY